MMGLFVAQYYGACAGCDEPILPGERAQFNRSGDVVHASCVARPDRERKPVVVCGDCFTQKPCACEDERKTA